MQKDWNAITWFFRFQAKRSSCIWKQKGSYWSVRSMSTVFSNIVNKRVAFTGKSWYIEFVNKLNMRSYDRGAGFISNFSCRDWLCAEYGHTQIQALGRMADWLEWKGRLPKDFFLSQERSSGLTQNMRQTVTVVERYLRYRSCEE